VPAALAGGAVAAWLEALGVTGLWERMEALSVAYQAERPGLETADPAGLVLAALRALCLAAARKAGAGGHDGHDVYDVYDVSKETPRYVIATSAIAQVAGFLAQEEETDTEHDGLSPRRVGRLLG
jgi:hypothetical protein